MLWSSSIYFHCISLRVSIFVSPLNVTPLTSINILTLIKVSFINIITKQNSLLFFALTFINSLFTFFTISFDHVFSLTVQIPLHNYRGSVPVFPVNSRSTQFISCLFISPFLHALYRFSPYFNFCFFTFTYLCSKVSFSLPYILNFTFLQPCFPFLCTLQHLILADVFFTSPSIPLSVQYFSIPIFSSVIVVLPERWFVNFLPLPLDFLVRSYLYHFANSSFQFVLVPISYYIPYCPFFHNDVKYLFRF